MAQISASIAGGSLMPAVQRRAFPLAGLMCTLRGIAHTHEGKAGITVPANASSSFSRRGDEESFETSTRACEGEFLESIKKGLPTIANPVYGYSAPAKSGVGIGVPITCIVPTRTKRVFLSAKFLRTQIMVGWMRLPKGRPVSIQAGYANLVQLTTSLRLASLGGEFKIHCIEAAIMATTPTQNPHFIWLIAAVRRDMPTITAKIHHIAAETEREARRTLARDHVCFFAGRIRLEVAA
ncbi:MULTISPECIES: host cell division inhibitor Icd-like protein [Enterobacter cloacae complex]|uniref:host cell division inhibitor Icd-like protein n=1 Tax=Enterobacter cloacae complex TaxID=354276 RepID=UPI0020067FC5|nr:MULTISPECIES: host cell division inhibitor Icd-like protein [Enterobacter cloacae complex]MCK6769267.1 host cell division inhibitor Icd-like protein [Enterobacter roggenkampii]MCS0624302.1 host cell division inhibitor Icd-like protein [Enterobacter asburiae]